MTPPLSGPEFSVVGSDVSSPWKLNQPIALRFTRAVDFTTVGRRSIRIETTDGVPAEGTFAFAATDTDGDGIPEVDPTQIVFQPRCPIEADGADAGLTQGVTYRITIAAPIDSQFQTLRSDDGRSLTETFQRSFDTQTGASAELYYDTKFGPPLPLLREVGSIDRLATFLEIGGDEEVRVYFEFDPRDQTVKLDPSDFLAPLNRFADPSERLVFHVRFDQSIEPSQVNLERMVIVYRDDQVFRPLETIVELVSNCSEAGSGALVRLTPRGLLPPDGFARVRIFPGFRDLTGEIWINPVVGFADVQTTAVRFESLVPADVLGDEVVASFDFGAPLHTSLEDPEGERDGAQAEWGGGVLRSSNGFEGTGGPGGNFDWVVRSGETVFFDTTATLVLGGENGIPKTGLVVEGGFLSLRSMTVEVGATVRVIGPNPLTIEATGSITIDGLIDASGFSGLDVTLLNTGDMPAPGGSGAAGGGRGGAGSPSTDTSSARGGPGEGPFGNGFGGMGGESGFAAKAKGKDARRPGGGGGGRFAPDRGDFFAERGFDGSPEGRGAVSGQSPAVGGGTNRGPFEDERPENDFFGSAPRLNVLGEVVDRIPGELPRPWAGYGGGGGGDAIPFDEFPAPGWGPGSDEKGGGGGGGGGQIRIQALGPITFGPLGEVRARGGRGGLGENTFFLDHIGGTGGSGTGGHVILESASYVSFNSLPDRAAIDTAGGPRTIGPVAGVPPDISHGGQGGPGLVQLHVPRPERGVGASPEEAGVVLPMDVLAQHDPLGSVTTPSAVILYPSFGSRSTARSRWISLGAAEQAEGGGTDLVSFLFKGTDLSPNAERGKVLVDGERVREIAPLFGPAPIDGLDARIEADGVSLSLRGDALAFGSTGALFDDIYLRTPALLQNFILRLSIDENSGADFDVAAATYDDAAAVLTLQTSIDTQTLADFVTTAGVPVSYAVIPRFFRLRSRLGPDRLPPGSHVRFLFQAAPKDAEGLPDESNLLVDWTADIRAFNRLEPGMLDFFRFRVEFELQSDGVLFDPDAGPIELDFLRVPFRF